MPLLRLFFALFLLPLLAVGTRAQEAPYTLSDRIGPELDARERAYFGLFPDYAEGFERAVVRDRGDSLVVAVRYAPGGVPEAAELVLSYEDGARLGRLVETFEDYADPVRNPHWKPLLPIETHVAVPFARRDRRVGVRTPEGVYVSQLLYTTDSLLVLAPTVEPSDPALPGAFALGLDEVESVTLEDRWRRLSRTVLPVGAAALSAGVIGLSTLDGDIAYTADELLVTAATAAGFGYAAAWVFAQMRERKGTPEEMAPLLADYAHYGEVHPPEFPDEDALPALQARPRPEPRPYRPARGHEWVSVGIQTGSESGLTGYGVGLAARDVESGSLRAGGTPGLQPAVGASYRVDLAVRPLTWVRAGVHLEPGKRDAAPTAEPLEELSVLEPGRVQGYLEGVLPLLRVGRGRVEVAAGVGVETYRQHVGFSAPERYTVGTISALLLEPLSYAYEAEGTSVFPRTTVEVFASESASFYLQWAWHRYPPVQVSEFGVFYYNDPSVQAYRVDGHSVDFGYRETLFGTRIHF